MFLEHLPFEACSRIWDVLILEGDAFLFRTAIAILGVMEARLFFPDRKELMEGNGSTIAFCSRPLIDRR